MGGSWSDGTVGEVRLGQGIVRYREFGSGRDAIVFVHGVLVNGGLWRAVAPALG